MMEPILNIIQSRRNMYSTKLTQFNAWSISKFGKYGSSDKQIRQTLYQMLKEMGIANGNQVISQVYGLDYDASKLIRIIKSNLDGGYYDLMSKDGSISSKSLEVSMTVMKDMKINAAAMTNVQIAGCCVFIQYILMGGRKDFDDFGTSDDLVTKWKKDFTTRKNKERQVQLEEERRANELRQRLLASGVVIGEQEDETPEKEEKLSRDGEIPDSWDM